MAELSVSLQENLLTVLCFDDQHGKLIRESVDLGLFGAEYRQIAGAAYSFFDKFGTAPKSHIADELEEPLASKDRQARRLRQILLALHNTKDEVNVSYTLSKLETFIRMQSMKSGIVAAATQLQHEETEEALEAAEALLQECVQKRSTLFDPGTTLSDFEKSLEFLTEVKSGYDTGIPALDRRGLGPARGQLNLFIALPKHGKTWWLVNLGKRAIMQGLKVAHISLEMSESLIAQRYFQTLFSVAKRDWDSVAQAKFEVNDAGSFQSFNWYDLKDRPSFSDPDIAEFLKGRVRASKRYVDRLAIKQFPTGQLTIMELKSYLDMLEISRGFIPDLVIVDYADLMAVETANYRVDLGRLYVSLRGLAVERNIALATASQSNRAGSGSAMITEANVAEDFSKIATADVILTYNQTSEEKRLGLARIFVAGGRGDEDRFTVILSQNYGVGQFVIDSAMMSFQYQHEVAANAEGQEDDE